MEIPIKNAENIKKSIKSPLVLGCIGVAIGALVLAFISMGRNFFTFGTETDFLARNIAEAIRAEQAMPLLIQFHPPFYSLVLAFFKTGFSDWFTIGLLISWLSSAVVFLTSFMFYYYLAGRFAAWGSLVGLMSSNIFITYSCLATQDLFFLALYSLCFFSLMLAINRNSNTFWAITGIIIGCALLTRSNALTLLMVLAFPIVLLKKTEHKLKGFASLCLACMIIVGSWALGAKIIGSPFTPEYGHVNLAMRYFPTEGDPFSVKARGQLVSKFGSFKDVIMYDPIHVAKLYVKDFITMIKKNFGASNLLPFLWGIPAIVGVFLLFYHHHSAFALLFLLTTFAQIGLVNFKSYEARFYLFLVPFLSAGLGVFFQYSLKVIKGHRLRIGFCILLFLLSFPGVKWSYSTAYRNLHAQDPELSEAVDAIQKLVSGSDVIVSLKPHIAFYLGAKVFIDDKYVKLPEFDNLENFRKWLLELSRRANVFIYFGSIEKRFRPQLRDLSNADNAPGWLEPMAASQDGKQWMFYRFRPDY
jgi:Dolichyl-phosphate-mannose-protein mannosyltransferase